MNNKTQNAKRKNSSKDTFTIGIDLGGTKLAGALIDKNGDILDYIKIPVEMRKDSSPLKTQKRIIGLMNDLSNDFKNRFPSECSSKFFKGIGLASAGPLNVERGELINPVNYPGWKIVPIQKMLQTEITKSKFKTQVFFQNDAIASALAEGWIGGAKKMSTYAVVTVGTGIGTGVIFNSAPCQNRGMGSEFGHLLVDIKDLDKNLTKRHFHTVEGIASGTGLQRRANEIGANIKSVEELVILYKNDKKKYQFLFDDMSFALASLCYNLSIGLNLEGIFISGGLIKVKELYFKDMKKTYNQLISDFNTHYKCPIEIAKSLNNAGVIGAGYLPYL